jgi:hypothetical protein
MLRDRVDDVAFRYKVTYYVTASHDQGTDTVRLHQLRGGSDRLSWANCEDFRIFPFLGEFRSV